MQAAPLTWLAANLALTHRRRIARVALLASSSSCRAPGAPLRRQANRLTTRTRILQPHTRCSCATVIAGASGLASPNWRSISIVVALVVFSPQLPCRMVPCVKMHGARGCACRKAHPLHKRPPLRRSFVIIRQAYYRVISMRRDSEWLVHSLTLRQSWSVAFLVC